MDTWQWDDTKPGPQMAMVWVGAPNTSGRHPLVIGEERSLSTFLPHAFLPIPPAMTDAERAVIEAAEKVYISSSFDYSAALDYLRLAVRTLRDSRQPRDPVAAEVTAAWSNIIGQCSMPTDAYRRMEAAIAALEKARPQIRPDTLSKTVESQGTYSCRQKVERLRSAMTDIEGMVAYHPDGPGGPTSLKALVLYCARVALAETEPKP